MVSFVEHGESSRWLAGFSRHDLKPGKAAATLSAPRLSAIKFNDMANRRVWTIALHR